MQVKSRSLSRPQARALARGFAAAAAVLVAATCRLDRLLVLPQGALLCVNPSAPDTLRDSAAGGSASARTDAIAISNCGAGDLRWTAFVNLGSPWLSIVPDSGTAGLGDAPPEIVFNPFALDTGVYHETVIVNSTTGSGAAEIPVSFYVHPCRVTPITINDSATATLTSVECGAPHRSGHYARVFSFPGTANDSVSIELPATFDPYVILDTTLDQTPLTEGADSAVYYQRLPRSTTYYVEVTSAAAADTGGFTLRLLHPRLPHAPDSLDQRLSDSVTSISPGATVPQTGILLRAVVSDPDLLDPLHLEAEVRPVTVAFTGPNLPNGPAVANGSPAWVNVSGLADKTAYHWRVRAGDQTGRSGPWATFGGNPAFAVNVLHPPNAPTTLGQARTDGSGILTGATVDTNVVILSAATSDPDPGDLVHLAVEVRPVGDAFSGPTDSSAAVVDGGPLQVTVGPLLGGTGYHWRARAVDQTGATSGWVSYGGNGESATDFAIAAPHDPYAPTALVQLQRADSSPIPVGGVSAASTVILAGIVSDSDPGQAVRLELEVKFLGQAFIGNPNYTSSFVAGNTTASVLAGPLVVGTGYHWQARTRNFGGGTSAWIPFPISPPNTEDSIDFSYQGSAPPVQIVFTVQPTTTKSNSPIAPPVQVTAQDANGLTNTDFTGNVTITLEPSLYRGKLSGTTTVAAVAGVATFSDLRINRPGFGYVLRATTLQPSLTTLSTSFTITR